MNENFQSLALKWYGVLAFGLLILMALSGYGAFTADTPEGTVPVGEGSAFAVLLLAFREVLGAMMKLTIAEREAVRDQQIYTSAPKTNPAPEPVKQPAGKSEEENEDERLD